MIYEHALPQKNVTCSQCNATLKPALQGKSKLLVRTKGVAAQSGGIERVDLCPECAALDQSNKAAKERGLHRSSKKPYVATWIWRKSKKATAHEGPALQREQLKGLLEELFSQKQYTKNAEEQYVLSLILHRGGVIKRRRGQNGSVIFIWDQNEGREAQAPSLTILFKSPPQDLSKELIDRVSSRIMGCFKASPLDNDPLDRQDDK